MENNEEILKKISSGDPEAIAGAVDTVKENGDLVIAGKLLDILSQPLAPSTITIIANLLADIKDNQFKDLLIQKLEQTSEGTLKKELLRIVWEASFDYSSYLDHFLQILQEDDFTVAFEASTVIENLVPHLMPEQRTKLTDILQVFPEDKKFLAENILEELSYQE